MLVLFPLFGPVCRGFLQKQKGFQCWYCSHYLLLFNVLPIFFVFGSFSFSLFFWIFVFRLLFNFFVWVLLTSVAILFSSPGLELRFCSSFLFAFVVQVCIWFLFILYRFVGFLKRLYLLNAIKKLSFTISLFMSSIVSGILSPTISVLFAVYLFVFILHKRFWKLVCLPVFAPI